MGWLSQFFINPAFVLPGAALVSLPILIHLINRMRYRRVKWAAMEFLLQSHQRNRRKLLLEQLLLLLLRVAAVLALVALIARPFFDPSQLLILQGQKTHHLVLLDDSGSMRDRWGETTAFAAGLEAVRKIAAQGARQPGTQTLTLLMLSDLDQPLFTEGSLDPGFLTELDVKLENVRCSFRELDLASGMQAAKEFLKNPAAAKNLHVVSDYRSADWQAESPLAATVKELDAAGVTVNLVRAVPDRHVNLAVIELSGNVNIAATNVPVRLRAGVRNYSENPALNVRLSVFLDGSKLPLSPPIDKIEPGQEVTVDIDVIFPTSGKHDVRVELPADALDADNVRFLAVDIADVNPVLIISGDLSDGEAEYLEDALAPKTGITGFAPVVETVEFLRRQPLEGYQCIYMLNVPEVPADALRILEQYVSAGGGLAWFMGPQVRAAAYNDKLFRDGQGLFPARLGIVSELLVDETNPAPDLSFADHPAFNVFKGLEYLFVDSVKITRYFSTAAGWTAPEKVRIIGQLRNRAPLFLEHRFGKGRIITSLSSCGPLWNDWARNPSFVLLQLELEKYLARNDRSLERRIVGEPIELVLDPASYRSQVEIRTPDPNNVVRLNLTPREIDPAQPVDPSAPAAVPPPEAAPATPSGGEPVVRLVETFRGTGAPGMYTVVRFRQDDSSESQAIAYNVPIGEGDLQIADTEQIRRRIGADVPIQIQEFGNFDWVQGKQAGQEIRDFILMALLAVLVVEQLLAMRLSFHPKTAGMTA